MSFEYRIEQKTKTGTDQSKIQPLSKRQRPECGRYLFYRSPYDVVRYSVNDVVLLPRKAMLSHTHKDHHHHSITTLQIQYYRAEYYLEEDDILTRTRGYY